MIVLPVNEYNAMQYKVWENLGVMYEINTYPMEYRPKLTDYLASCKGGLLNSGYVAMQGNLHIARKSKNEAVRVFKEYKRQRAKWHGLKGI